jgi:hypothetical protein
MKITLLLSMLLLLTACDKKTPGLRRKMDPNSSPITISDSSLHYHNPRGCAALASPLTGTCTPASGFLVGKLMVPGCSTVTCSVSLTANWTIQLYDVNNNNIATLTESAGPVVTISEQPAMAFESDSDNPIGSGFGPGIAHDPHVRYATTGAGGMVQCPRNSVGCTLVIQYCLPGKVPGDATRAWECN